MKEKYIKPDCEVNEFERMDICTTPSNGTYPEVPDNDTQFPM